MCFISVLVKFLVETLSKAVLIVILKMEILLTLKEMVMRPILYTFYKMQLMFGLSCVGKVKFWQSAINDFYKESNTS